MLLSKHNIYSSTEVWSTPVNQHRHLKGDEGLLPCSPHCSATCLSMVTVIQPSWSFELKMNSKIGSCFWQEVYQTKTPPEGVGLNQKGVVGGSEKENRMLLQPPNKLAILIQSRRSKQWPFLAKHHILHKLNGSLFVVHSRELPLRCNPSHSFRVKTLGW